MLILPSFSPSRATRGSSSLQNTVAPAATVHNASLQPYRRHPHPYTHFNRRQRPLLPPRSLAQFLHVHFPRPPPQVLLWCHRARSTKLWYLTEPSSHHHWSAAETVEAVPRTGCQDLTSRERQPNGPGYATGPGISGRVPEVEFARGSVD